MRLRVTWTRQYPEGEPNMGTWYDGKIEGFGDFLFRVTEGDPDRYFPEVDYLRGHSDVYDGVISVLAEKVDSSLPLEEAQDWCVDTFKKMLARWMEAVNGYN